ncbi:MAG: hypothetical protein LBN22_00815 [Clostridiales Family XIII bacterium]|jgi:lipopolysaccharide biosynthesis glycosyltransferase|nr:hypothetical protein [Clostridiales Family XIII bacterium]
MKPPLKYSLYSILYHAGEKGIWEYEIYSLLKSAYNQRALVKVREILIELKTKAWTDEVETILYNDELVRKYKLQSRHNSFIEYMLPNTVELLAEVGVDAKAL